MRMTLELGLSPGAYESFDVDFYQLEASRTGGRLYTWKTIGLSNWLERNLSVADVAGLIVLPDGLPETIDMPDDELEDGQVE